MLKDKTLKELCHTLPAFTEPDHEYKRWWKKQGIA
jgi:hypothetical protein